jgi:A/G-specific adenine glycosylase
MNGLQLGAEYDTTFSSSGTGDSSRDSMASTNITSRTPFDSAYKRQFQRRLLTWYRRSARDLPWRRTSDPYAVWVSEVMLQQTQVATVVPYYQRFLERFPTIASLAAADEQQVLKLWEGLGYYRRARQLHRAAQVIVAHHAGIFPREGDAVRRLPGIGRYTAGAILSIALDAREPILEANTLRLLSRVLAFDGDPHAAAGQERLWAAAAALLPAREAGTFNQALMELGSQICLPREPNCDSCPVAELCLARERGLQDRIPRPKPKPATEAVRETAVVVWRSKRVLLWRRDASSPRWAGLWDFPRFPSEARNGDHSLLWLEEQVAAQTGMRVQAGELVATLKHSVTRFRITLDCYAAKYLSTARKSAPRPETCWTSPAELDRFPLSTTGRKLARLLQA